MNPVLKTGWVCWMSLNLLLNVAGVWKASFFQKALGFSLFCFSTLVLRNLRIVKSL